MKVWGKGVGSRGADEPAELAALLAPHPLPSAAAGWPGVPALCQPSASPLPRPPSRKESGRPRSGEEPGFGRKALALEADAQLPSGGPRAAIPKRLGSGLGGGVPGASPLPYQGLKSCQLPDFDCQPAWAQGRGSLMPLRAALHFCRQNDVGGRLGIAEAAGCVPQIRLPPPSVPVHSP